MHHNTCRFLDYLELSEVILRILPTTFYLAVKDFGWDFGTEIHRYVVVKHKEHDRCTSYTEPKNRKNVRHPSSFILL